MESDTSFKNNVSNKKTNEKSLKKEFTNVELDKNVTKLHN